MEVDDLDPNYLFYYPICVYPFLLFEEPPLFNRVSLGGYNKEEAVTDWIRNVSEYTAYTRSGTEPCSTLAVACRYPTVLKV